MSLDPDGIDPSVQNIWGLTRRRVIDFGRGTTGR
jgi:hypothetical protein